MFDEAQLVSRIKTITGYSVNLLESSQFAWADSVLTTPEIRVGHQAIRPVNEADKYFYSDGYQDLEKPLILLTKIEIYCPRSSWATVRTNVANSYKGWTPVAPAGLTNFSAIIFVEANLEGVSNNNVWWSELVGTVFPRIY